MSEIKTWKSLPGSAMLRNHERFMQAEINELRAALVDRDAKLAALEKQEALGDGYTKLATTRAGGFERVTITGIPVYTAAGAAPPKVLMHQLINDKVELQHKLDAALAAAPTPSKEQSK